MKQRNLFVMLVLLPLLATAQNTTKKQAPLTFGERMYFTSGFGLVCFDHSGINDGDQRVVQSVCGKGYSGGIGFRVTRHLFIEAESARKNGSGKIQILDNTLANEITQAIPPDSGITADAILGPLKNPNVDLRFSTMNWIGTVNWGFLPGHRFNPFAGGGMMATRIHHVTTGTIPVDFNPDTLTVITGPLRDVGTETHPEAILRAGTSFPLFHGMEGTVEYQKVIRFNSHIRVNIRLPFYVIGIGKGPTH